MLDYIINSVNRLVIADNFNLDWQEFYVDGLNRQESPFLFDLLQIEAEYNADQYFGRSVL